MDIRELGRIVDQMEFKGIISGWEGSKPRKVLITKERWEEMKEEKKYGRFYEMIKKLDKI